MELLSPGGTGKDERGAQRQSIGGAVYDLCAKMIDERRLGYAEGREEGLEQGVAQGLEKGMAQGMEQGLKKAIVALKGVLDPAVIAERFQIPLEQVQGILEQG